MQHKIGAIVKWLQDQVKASGTKGLVVGISGGVDSAVVAELIKRAFPNDSLGVIMPLKSSSRDLKDAKHVVESSGISHMNIDLTSSHEVMYTAIKSEVENEKTWYSSKDRLADANLRARLRMSTLYTLATNFNYLVVGTDNASEWFTGYFTKYGDGGVDLLPLVDFTKTEIWEMADYLEVPNEVIQKTPSADLWEGQTDEDEMGTTYEKIDAYLNGESVPENDKKIIEKMHQQTEHKRNTPTPFRFKQTD